MNPPAISIDAYNYPLPDERIAKYPLPERDMSKLLIYREGQISETVFRRIADELPSHSLLVRNNTRVIRARLLFEKETGGRVEIFCLEPEDPRSYELSLAAKKACLWHCLIGNARRWRMGRLRREVSLSSGHVVLLEAERLPDEMAEGALVRFSWSDEEVSFAEILEAAGVLPIPPYLNRETEESDLNTYQTIYAKHKGSVAAPTAGLHFTPSVFEDFDGKDISLVDITLHVGAGTFRPVKASQIADHHMHEERVAVSRETIEELASTDRSVIAVGTTSVRTLESLYWLGLQMIDGKVQGQRTTDLLVEQWEPYEQSRTSCPTRKEVYVALKQYLDAHGEKELVFSTRILIAPGYVFRALDGMVTNFHQPKSTLLLLISAFVGEDWQRIYTYALTNGFRFLSYGDSSLLLPAQKKNGILKLPY